MRTATEPAYGREHGLRTVLADVLVIGGGAAGTRAAVAAAAAGARTVLTLKGEVGHSGSTCYPARGPHGSAYQAADGCSAADGDSPDEHYRDILAAALDMADARLARILADEAPERLRELIEWGFVPDPEPEPEAGRGRPHWAGYSCFATRPRAHGIWDVSAGHAGALVLAAATQLERWGVAVMPHVMIADLLVQDGACAGALGIDTAGHLLLFRAGAVVLSTGGAGQLFPQATASHEATGDGYAMALRAGAELTNLEYMQFMVRASPGAAGGPGFPGLWTLYPEVRNVYGESVLERYLPAGVAAEEACEARTHHYPFSTRDASGWLDVAIRSEILAGRGFDGPVPSVLLDLNNARSRARAAAGVRARPQHHYPGPTSGPVPLPDGPVRVTHAAHAINGGVRISPRAESTLPGLFAAGETAAGAHGADRLGGNMLPNTQVFGRRAGLYAAECARQSGGALPLRAEAVEAPLGRLRHLSAHHGTRRPNEVKHELQALAARTLFVVRSQRSLAALLTEVARLRAEALPAIDTSDRAGLCGALEVDDLLLVAEAMGRAALARTESRGGHFRADFPARDDARWATNLLVRWTGSRLTLRTGRLAGG